MSEIIKKTKYSIKIAIPLCAACLRMHRDRLIEWVDDMATQRCHYVTINMYFIHLISVSVFTNRSSLESCSPLRNASLMMWINRQALYEFNGLGLWRCGRWKWKTVINANLQNEKLWLKWQATCSVQMKDDGYQFSNLTSSKRRVNWIAFAAILHHTNIEYANWMPVNHNFPCCVASDN